MSEIFYMLLTIGFVISALMVVLLLHFFSTIKEYLDKGILAAGILYIIKRFTK